MLPLILLCLLLPGPALLTPSTSRELEVRGQRTPRDAEQDSIKVVISDGCTSQGDSTDGSQGGKAIDLVPGSPLVFTHKIKLLPSESGSGSASCSCEADFATLRERLERLEREVSDLREKCGGPEGGCCSSESKGAGCSIKPGREECPNECSDQGSCVDGRCVCFTGYSGADCSESTCPADCNNHGRCVNGECVCDPGFSGADCSQTACPDSCSNRGRCTDGRCVCDAGFNGPSCSEEACPGNCSKRGRCVDGRCVCNPGLTGLDCSKRACPDNCNNHGRCVNGKCVCYSGFTGADCSLIACPGKCNNRGRCVNGQCVCNDGFTRADCSEKSCPGNCNNRGRCVDGQCVCNDGFTGADCSEKSCPGNCNNRGRCVDGQCVCNDRFTGTDCSDIACPGNCNNRGRCVEGQCVCSDGFTGEDCSEKSCPNNCNNLGRCVDGKCVCDSGFTGTDCSEKPCLNNCNNRGRCVNGQCVCDDGFTGADCSGVACPENCNSRGRCVNGKCVCDVGFAGPDCSVKGCPNNCSNRGRCMRGRCACRRGFTGPDCSQCQGGLTGPNCNIAMMGVSQLSARDVTESSVTLVWTQPLVQYDTYYITFTSQKETDQQITSQVEGSLTTFTQTGLAAGQEYRVRIVGEIDGRKGAESTTEFITLISGPTNLQVVKTTSTSAVVQWEPSQGEVDRYRLTITPNDGGGRSQEMNVPPSQNSAHILQLEAGRLYKILLVAEKDLVLSQAATTQVVPGNTLSEVTTEDLTTQVTQAPGKDAGSTNPGFNSSLEASDQKDGRKDVSVKVRDPSDTVAARTKPMFGKMVARNGTRATIVRRPSSKLKVPGHFRTNGTRVIPGGRRFVPSPMRKNLLVTKKPQQIEITKPNTDVEMTIRDSVINQGEEASSPERRDEKSSAEMPESDSETNRPPSADGLKNQPDVGIAKPENDTDSVSLKTTGTSQSQETKCLNKIKVTHFRFPLKDRGNGCKGDETELQENTGSDPDETPPQGETDLDYTPGLLHKLITDTLDDLNVTTISVHLSKPLNLSADAEKTRSQILRGLKPLSSSSSSISQLSSHSSTTKSSSSAAAAAESPSLLTYLTSSSAPSSSSSSSSSDEFDSDGSNKLDSVTDSSPPMDDKPTQSEKSITPLPHHTPPKPGSVRRPNSNFELPQNQTSQSLRVPYNTPPRLNQTSETSGSSGIEHRLKTILTQRAKIPVRRPPPKGTYPHQRSPNFQNQTRTSQFLNPQRDTQKFPIELQNNSSSVFKDSLPLDSVPVRKGNEGRTGARPSTTSSPNEFHQTTRGRGGPSSRRSNVRHPHRPSESFQNKTFTNFRQSRYPNRGPVSKSFPIRKQNMGRFPAGSQRNELGKDRFPQNPRMQSGHQNVNRSFGGFLSNQSGGQENNQSSQSVPMYNHNVTATELDKGDNDLTGEETVKDPYSHRKRFQPGRNGAVNQGSPSIKSDFRPLRQPPSRTVTAKHHYTHSMSGGQSKELPKTNQAVKSLFEPETEQTEGTPSNVSPSGATRESPDSAGVTDRTSDGFTLMWDSPERKYEDVAVSRTEDLPDEKIQPNENVQKTPEEQYIKEFRSESVGRKEDNRVPENIPTQVPNTQGGRVGGNKTFKKVPPGSADSIDPENLPPQTEYTLTLLGNGPGLLSRLHKVVISTGPEPPTNIVFSRVTENSLTVSWNKPKSPVSGFKVTYTHADDGEPVSVSVGSEDSALDLSQLSPGSSYEVTVISMLGPNESDPVKDFVMTLPDPPTDLRAVNVTDTKALLLWRPALAAVDKYAIVYGSGTGSELRITVSGNAAEQQLSGLEGSTTYTVTITSQLGSLESSRARTSFTTSSGSVLDNDEAQDLQAKNVTPRTAVVSWTPSSKPVDRHILVYQAEGEESKEIVVGPDVTQHKLTRLYPGSLYNVNLQTVRGGRLIANSFTKFTTGTLRFPFPTDCSQELLNGILTSDVVEIYPQGKEGKSVTVHCDMETEGGGWTVFQRRKDGSVNFYRGWNDYVNGFGDVSGEFWLGLEKLHTLTAMTRMTLRVDLRDGGEPAFARYSTFEVAKRNYRLTVGGYSGSAGDSLSYHNNCVFSTKDRDPAPGITRCAISYRGGWWYKNCHEANLNGLYGINFKHQGVIWKTWKGKKHSIQFTEMKMRPSDFSPPARRRT